MRTCGSEVRAHLSLSSSSSSWWMPRVSLAVACLLSFVSVSILYIKLNVYSATLRVCATSSRYYHAADRNSIKSWCGAMCMCAVSQPWADEWQSCSVALKEHAKYYENMWQRSILVHMCWRWGGDCIRFAPGKSISGWDYLLMESPK